MLAKSSNQPLPFVDGSCAVYTIKKRTIDEFLGIFDFREETVGIQAFTEFGTLGIQVDKAISVPYNNVMEIGRVLRINDDTNLYQITMIQKKDTFPKSLRLTLTKYNIKWTDINGDLPHRPGETPLHPEPSLDI